MFFKVSVAVAAACLLGSTAAFPLSGGDVEARANANAYIAPKPYDSRSPCPGLNTLANHGFLPRNGRNISRDDLVTGFLNGFGVDASVTNLATDNAFSVCYYVMGSVCQTLPNLTLLAEPHTLEHDHSFSRQDYHMAWAGPKGFANNQNFNKSIFDTSIAALSGASHMDYVGANQVRLNRESLAYQADLPGWFLRDPIVQGVELGFIFGVMTDPTLPNADTKPQVRVDWWKYWTVNESFPTPLGWKKPNPPRNSSFVLSVSSKIYHTTAHSTNAVNPPATQLQTNVALKTTKFATVLPLPTDAPYVAPGFAKRHADDIAARNALQADVLQRLQSAEAAAPPAPIVNPYFEKVSPEKWAAVAAVRRERFESIRAALETPAP